MTNHKLIAISLPIIVGMLAGLTAVFYEAQNTTISKSIALPPAEQHNLYVAFTPEQMYALSDGVFIGKVTGFSSTKWNQDNGEYWEYISSADSSPADSTPLQYHQIEFRVLKTIVDDINLDKKTVVVTATGNSPLDGKPDHDLQVGDKVVVFVMKTDLSWRNGTREILRFVNAPSLSYLKEQADGRFKGLSAEQSISGDNLSVEIFNAREKIKKSDFVTKP